MKAFIIYITSLSVVLSGIILFSHHANPDYFDPYYQDAPLFVSSSPTSPEDVCGAMRTAFIADQQGDHDNEVTELVEEVGYLAERLANEHQQLRSVARTTVSAWHASEMLTLNISLNNFRTRCEALPGFSSFSLT